MWRTIGITFKGDRGYGNDRTIGEPFFQVVILRLAFSHTETPAVIMNHDDDMVRVVKRRCSAIEGGVIEVPLGRSELPNELREIVPIFLVAGAAVLRGEIVLVPPCEFRLWR